MHGHTLKLYVKEQTVRLHSKLARARFLNGQAVRGVWCELQNRNGKWKPASLILNTDSTLTAQQVVKNYGLHWSIEPMLNQLK